MTTPNPSATASTARNPMRPRDAWRALEALVRDPDETAHVFTIIDALSGNTGERLFRRFLATEVGQRVLSEERDILATLTDRSALRALPEGSLGRTYADFMEAEKISADGLVDASQEGGGGPNEDASRARFGARLRDTHDLWHVVTAYGRDLVGEASLLAFTFAQTRNPGIGFIVAAAYLLSGREKEGREARRVIRDAYRRGRRSAWLPAADWEALLERPLERVRSELAVGTPVRYIAVRSAAGQAALSTS